jgi:hypothetical protein
MVSCVNISMSSQIYGPGPVRCDAGWRFVIHFSISRNNDERQPRRKVAIFSRLLLFDDVKHSPVAPSNLSALEPLSRMDRERRALLSHAALCRRVAGEISHTNAAKRLRMMAQEYETRALRLAGVRREAEDDVGASSEMFKTEQTHSERVTDA